MVTRLDPLWTWRGNDSGVRSTGIGELKPNVAFGDVVLTNTFDANGYPSITALDIALGKDIWTWSGYRTDTRDYISARDVVTHEGVAYFTHSRNWYGISLSSGEEVNSRRFEPRLAGDLSTLGNDFFVVGHPADTLTEYLTSVVFRGTFGPLTLKRILAPPLDFDPDDLDGGRIGGTGHVSSYVAESGDTMLVVGWGKLRRWQPEDTRYRSQSFIGLYNFSDQQWVYDDVEVGPRAERRASMLHPIQRHGDYVLASTGRTMHVRRLADGGEVWSRELPGEIWISGFTLVDGVVVVNCENSVAYGFDLETGAELWTAEGAQFATPLRDNDLNGIVYYVGGYVYAVEAATGRLVWRLDASLAPHPADFYSSELSVAPGRNGEKGRVIVKTGSTVYCYEAYR